MQITNSVVCGTSKGCIYKQIKPPLVVEHAIPLTGFVCKVGSRYIWWQRWENDNCQTGVALPMYIYVVPRPSLGARLLGGGSNVTFRSTDINRYANYKLGSLWYE